MMVKGPEHEDDAWIEGLTQELKRVDELFEDVPSPSLEGMHKLAVHTLERRRRRMKYELILFLLIALFNVGGGLMAALAAPMILLFIHGFGMVAGIAVLVFSKSLRSAGKKGI
ncbi:YxlC family protein [Paenibacillus lautus]|uniref:YxlC family protein n=1 Tax=Paenibacillus lautus TaxID=1401 RepID=UPI003D294B7B